MAIDDQFSVGSEFGVNLQGDDAEPNASEPSPEIVAANLRVGEPGGDPIPSVTALISQADRVVDNGSVRVDQPWIYLVKSPVEAVEIVDGMTLLNSYIENGYVVFVWDYQDSGRFEWREDTIVIFEDVTLFDGSVKFEGEEFRFTDAIKQHIFDVSEAEVNGQDYSEIAPADIYEPVDVQNPGSAQSSGSRYRPLEVGDVGDGLAITELQLFSELGFPVFESRDFEDLEEDEDESSPPPTLQVTNGAVSDAGLANGTQPFSGFDQDTMIVRVDNDGGIFETLLINGVDVTEGGVVAGEFGTLIVTLSDDGDFSLDYTLTTNADHPETGTIPEDFRVTVTNADGQIDEAVVTVEIEDDMPVLLEIPSILIDDDALADGNPGGAGDDEDRVNVTGSIDFEPGADGGTIVWLQPVTTPDGFGYVIDGGGSELQIFQGEILIATAIINPQTGDYSITQNAPVVHGLGDTENNLTLPLSFGVTDGDDDSVSGEVLLNFDDDTPLVVPLDGSSISALLDESSGEGSGSDGINLVTISSDEITALFDSGAGADGAASITYQLNLEGDQATGLFVTGQSEPADEITLSLVSPTQVYGVAGDGTVAFSIILNDASGAPEITVVQNESLDHPLTGGSVITHDDALTLVDVVFVSQTIVDRDGDSITGVSSAGISIQFEDDGPVATIALNDGVTAVVDESLGENAGEDENGSLGSVTVAGATLFNIAGTNAGEDEEGATTVYSLSIIDAASSGLSSTAGDAITLVDNNGVIEGQYAGGTVAFTIGIDAGTGDLTVTQLESLSHPTGGSSFDEAVTLSSGALETVLTVTDGDGDIASASVDLGGGAIQFEDDGPSVEISLSEHLIVVDESIGADDGLVNGAAPEDEVGQNDPFGLQGSMIGYALLAASGFITLNSASGSDGLGTDTALSLTSSSGGTLNGTSSGLVQTQTGNGITLNSLSSGVVVGNDSGTGEAVFAIGFDGSGNMVLVQYSAVAHGDTTNPDDQVTLGGTIFVTASITDGDGDIATATSATALDIIFEDDGPALGAFTSGVIPNEVGTVSGSFEVDFGSDGVGDFNITPPSIPGVTYSQQTTSDGVILTATAGNDTLFELSVNFDGTYVFELITPEAGSTVLLDLNNLASGNSGFVETADFALELDDASGSINISGGGFGIANNFLGNGESVELEFYQNGSAGNDDPGGPLLGGVTNPDNRYVDQIEFTGDRQGSSSLTLRYTAFNDSSGQTETGTLVLTSDPEQIVIDPSIEFNRLLLEGISPSSGQGYRFVNPTITETVLPGDQTLSFTVDATDGDNDPASSQTLDIFILGGDGSSFSQTGDDGDNVLAASTVADAIDGGLGFDFVDYADSVGGVDVNLATMSGTSGDAAGDTYANIEGIIGSAQADTLTGDSGANTLNGGAGADMLTGGAGSDTFNLDDDALADALIGVTDTITDYEENVDVVDLSGIVDLDSGSGMIQDFVGYDSMTGELSVDVDGSDAGASPVVVATISNTPGTVTIVHDDGTDAITSSIA